MQIGQPPSLVCFSHSLRQPICCGKLPDLELTPPIHHQSPSGRAGPPLEIPTAAPAAPNHPCPLIYGQRTCVSCTNPPPIHHQFTRSASLTAIFQQAALQSGMGFQKTLPVQFSVRCHATRVTAHWQPTSSLTYASIRRRISESSLLLSPAPA
jgi:hypothetical protein